MEGNIGSGKSTLLKEMSKEITSISTNEFLFFKREYSIIYVQEPVDIWNTIKDSKNNTILENFYSDKRKFAFPFQMLAFISRAQQINKIISENKKLKKDVIIISERSVFTDKEVFAKMLYHSGDINDIEYAIYLKWFEELTEKIKNSGIIHLNTPPNVAKDRVISRNRTGEDKIDFDYLLNLHNYTSHWLKKEENVLTLEYNNENLISEIVNFIKIKINQE